MECHSVGKSTSSKCHYSSETRNFHLPARKALIQVLVALVLDLVGGAAVAVVQGVILESLMSQMDQCGLT